VIHTMDDLHGAGEGAAGGDVSLHMQRSAACNTV
jgi:hypothetical protein